MSNNKNKSIMRIIVVILMLTAIMGYVLSLDESDPAAIVEEVEN